MVVGDFNSVTFADETSTKGRLDQRRYVGFLQWIYENELINLGFQGHCFTWSRGNLVDMFTGARLER